MDELILLRAERCGEQDNQRGSVVGASSAAQTTSSW